MKKIESRNRIGGRNKCVETIKSETVKSSARKRAENNEKETDLMLRLEQQLKTCSNCKIKIAFEKNYRIRG